jgi:hypothetical protein
VVGAQANVVSKIGDGKVTAVDLVTQDGTMTGCDDRPDVAEDVTISGMLAPAINAKLSF